jgi:hypothetical protein
VCANRAGKISEPPPSAIPSDVSLGELAEWVVAESKYCPSSILDGLDCRKIPRYADEAELQHKLAVEKRELDWLNTNKVP